MPLYGLGLVDGRFFLVKNKKGTYKEKNGLSRGWVGAEAEVGLCNKFGRT
jgi:hypothetical protein